MRLRVALVTPRQTGKSCRVSARKSVTVTGSVRSIWNCCGTYAMRPRPAQCATMRPSNGMRPRTADSRVVLPAPFGPTMRVQRAPLDGQ